MTLKQAEVDTEEERLRRVAASLPDDTRKAFYSELKRELRDPDTYAVLNWFFLVGLHHVYLRRWGRAILNISLVLLGGIFLVAQEWMTGAILILVVVLLELWELFRSQIIVQDWNNRVFQKVLSRYGNDSRYPDRISPAKRNNGTDRF